MLLPRIGLLLPRLPVLRGLLLRWPVMLPGWRVLHRRANANRNPDQDDRRLLRSRCGLLHSSFGVLRDGESRGEARLLLGE